MYPRYLRETLGHELYEDPKGRGFLTYGFDCIPGVDFPHAYIVDIYVVPEHRKSRVATEMADHIAGMARKFGKNVLFGTVNGQSSDPDRSLKVLQGYGMRLYAIEKDSLTMCKEL